MVWADLLPALKGEGSLWAVHRFVVYRLHPHHLIACGDYPPRSARPAVDQGLGLQPITPIPHRGLPPDPGDSGICRALIKHPLAGTLFTLFYSNIQRFKSFTPPLDVARLVVHLLSPASPAPHGALPSTTPLNSHLVWCH